MPNFYCKENLVLLILLTMKDWQTDIHTFHDYRVAVLLIQIKTILTKKETICGLINLNIHFHLFICRKS